METLLAGAICGSVYALTAGQPLNIVGATGPLLIFETLLYKFSRFLYNLLVRRTQAIAVLIIFKYKYKIFHFISFSEQGIDFLSFRFWIGLWVTLILLVIVALDLSALVRYITRFTEESFAVLISFIFIYESFSKVFKIWKKSPMNLHIDDGLECYCVPPSNETMTSWTTTTIEPDSNATEAEVSEPFIFWNFSSGVADDCVNHKAWRCILLPNKLI